MSLWRAGISDSVARRRERRSSGGMGGGYRRRSWGLGEEPTGGSRFHIGCTAQRERAAAEAQTRFIAHHSRDDAEMFALRDCTQFDATGAGSVAAAPGATYNDSSSQRAARAFKVMETTACPQNQPS